MKNILSKTQTAIILLAGMLTSQGLLIRPLKQRLCHIIWLIFDGKLLRNTACFARLQTAGGMRPRIANRNRVELASKASFPHLLTKALLRYLYTATLAFAKIYRKIRSLRC